MVSAIWSMPPYEATQMPLSFFLNFFKNHGLFKIKDRPQWFTVANRSKTYVDKVISQISGEHFKNYNINKVVRSDFGAKIFYGEENEFFDYDKVVIATHADEALKMAAQTAKGAASLLIHNQSHPEDEIDKVTSPKGCTIAGLNEMEHNGFSSSFIKGITISAKKAKGLYTEE